jgi:hypothetical protein
MGLGVRRRWEVADDGRMVVFDKVCPKGRRGRHPSKPLTLPPNCGKSLPRSSIHARKPWKHSWCAQCERTKWVWGQGWQGWFGSPCGALPPRWRCFNYVLDVPVLPVQSLGQPERGKWGWGDIG